jgi:hypothetical protein
VVLLAQEVREDHRDRLDRQVYQVHKEIEDHRVRQVYKDMDHLDLEVEIFVYQMV